MNSAKLRGTLLLFSLIVIGIAAQTRLVGWAKPSCASNEPAPQPADCEICNLEHKLDSHWTARP